MLIIRHAPKRAKSSSKPKTSKAIRKKELSKNGDITVAAIRGPSFTAMDLRGYLFRFHGFLAKLPSTTNHRMITVPRLHLIKMINQGASRAQLIQAVKRLRGYITKNEEQAARLEVMTEKLNQKVNGTLTPLAIDSKNRGLVLMLLGPACNRSDTHNMPKAVCDWLEEIGVISNDRYVDVFARRKTDLGMDSESSDVIVMLYDQERTLSVDAVFKTLTDSIRDAGGLLYGDDAE